MIVPPGFSKPLFFGVVDHGDGDAVLHRSARIHVVRLDVHFGGIPLVIRFRRTEWRLTDGFEDVVTLHRSISDLRASAVPFAWRRPFTMVSRT